MYLTQETLREIENYLKRTSVRDTDFPNKTYPLTGDEYVAIVENGKNVKVRLGDIILSTANGISVSIETGNWVINGVDSGINAVGPKGEKGKDGITPKLRISGNKLQVSYVDGVWYNISDFTNNLYVKGYFDTLQELKNTITKPHEGDMYMVKSSSFMEDHKWVLYIWSYYNDVLQWVDNGTFTSNSYGIDDNPEGVNPDLVVSQKYVNERFNTVEQSINDEVANRNAADELIKNDLTEITGRLNDEIRSVSNTLTSRISTEETTRAQDDNIIREDLISANNRITNIDNFNNNFNKEKYIKDLSVYQYSDHRGVTLYGVKKSFDSTGDEELLIELPKATSDTAGTMSSKQVEQLEEAPKEYSRYNLSSMLPGEQFDDILSAVRRLVELNKSIVVGTIVSFRSSKTQNDETYIYAIPGHWSSEPCWRKVVVLENGKIPFDQLPLASESNAGAMSTEQVNLLKTTNAKANENTTAIEAEAKTREGEIKALERDIKDNNIAIRTKISLDEKGAPKGVATLDENGIISTSQLPSYIDDIVEINKVIKDYALLPSPESTTDRIAVYKSGTSGDGVYVVEGRQWVKTEYSSDKIYLILEKSIVDDTTFNANSTWRWSGSQLTEVASSLVIGSTTGTAYDGGKGTVLEDKISKIQDGSDTTFLSSNTLVLGTPTTTILHYNTHNVKTGVEDEKDLVIPSATQADAGVMSTADKKKLDDIDKNINEYNISAIKDTEYANLQGAINALNTYLADERKKVGIKVTFVKTTSGKAETWMYQGGAFASVASWSNQPLGGFYRKENEVIGIELNERTGFYEFNGVLNLTETDASVIRNTPLRFIGHDVSSSMRSFNGRTNWTVGGVDYGYGVSYNFQLLFWGNKKLEVIKIPEEIGISNADGAFGTCPKLKRIKGVFHMRNKPETSQMFLGDVALESFQMYGLQTNLDLSSSPTIEVEDSVDSTLGCIVTNAANTSPITITLHHDAFIRVPQTLVEKGKAKQISFADASAA